MNSTAVHPVTSVPKNYPEWFTTALETPCQSGQTQVDGCKINFVSWGNQGKPGLVLLHGSNAHLEWWRMIAPLLSDQFHVVAMDSSGSGNSGWRENYTGKQFAKEAVEVAKAAGLAGKLFIAGHSFGGFITLEAGHHYGEQLAGIIMLDSTVRSTEMSDEFAEMRKEMVNTPVRPTRIYPDKTTALGRFRLVPEQPCNNAFIIDYLAGHSLREVDGGWTWKFDPGMFRNLSMSDGSGIESPEKLLTLKCPAAFIMAEQSTDYSADSADYTREITEGVIPMFTIPGTYHHLMFDEPNAVAMAMKALLLAWQTR